MRGNTIAIHLHNGRIGHTGNLFQYDTGQRLIISGCDLPVVYQAHFSNDPNGQTKTVIGDETGVDIPDEYLATGKDIHVWVYVAGEDHAETEYYGIIGVTKRAQPTDIEPTPAQQSTVDQLIEQLNSGVETVETVAENIPETIQTALQEAKDSGEFDGKDGEPGQDGYTPIKGVDYFDGEPGKDGADGEPGAPGQDGVSPTITVTDITGGHRVTITDATGPYSFDVMDGETPSVPVQDVQVNGTSIINNGVANIPAASSYAYGLVKVLPGDRGIYIGSGNGDLGILKAQNTNEIKAGANQYRPIVPYNQHESAFYGLAKAAGDTTQSTSNNAVGQYTETAKSKISDMLGFSEIIGTNEGATASQAYTIGKAFLHGGKLYKVTANISAGDAIVPGTNCEQTTLIEMIE